MAESAGPALPRSRRTVIAAAIGGAAAWISSTLGRPSAVHAEGEAMAVGGDYVTATSTTTLTNTANATVVFRAESTAGGTGVRGASNTFYGVHASSGTNHAIWAVTQGSPAAGLAGQSLNSSTGVYGFSGLVTDSLGTVHPKTGVHGVSDIDIFSRGVYGESVPGAGVEGRSEAYFGVIGSSASGHGVQGYSDLGVGVRGMAIETSTGVYGASADTPPPPAKNAGVVGFADWDTTSVGVVGESPAGVGVFAKSLNGFALEALSATGTAIRATTDGPAATAVIANATTGGTGVLGYAGGSSATPTPRVGVQGVSDVDSTSRGVYGVSPAGTGVRGHSSSGTGLFGSTTTGIALRAVGRVKLDKCAGVTTITTGTNAVTVTPGIDLVSTSAVVATLQGNPSGTTTVKSVAINPTANTFRIYLTANAATNVKVAWHVFG